MSLYLYTQKLEDLFENTNLDYTFAGFDDDFVIAHHKSIKLYYKNYSEEKLESFIQKHPLALVNKYFWNINYCKNINVENKDLEKDLPLVDLNTYFMGKLSSYIGMLSIILDLFTCKDYTYYINELVVDKNLFRCFLNEIDYTFPLTNRFLEFTKFIFDGSNIISYLFSNNRSKYNLLQTRTILENIPFDSINQASKYIFTLSTSDGNKLCYINLLIDLYQDDIDITKIVYISNSKRKEYLGYYLLTLDVTTELFNLYIDTIKTYYNKRGSVCYKIIDNPELNSIFEKNEKIIKDILQIKCDLLEY